MDTTFSGNAIINISDAVIENISIDGTTTFVTISYTDCINCQRNEQTLRLVVGRQTIILNERGNSITVRDLRVGMTINAAVSSAMTRSIPPQATAFTIRIISQPMADTNTVGRIIDINRQNRSFTTISDGNFSSVVQFNVPTNTLIFDRIGRPMSFSRLMPGMRVRIRHANFMTASLPPQTTAFEIRVL